MNSLKNCLTMLKQSFKKYNPPEYSGSSNVFGSRFYHYRSPGNPSPDAVTPHSTTSLVNTSTNAPDDQIPRSELLVVILYKPHILTLRHWPGHCTLVVRAITPPLCVMLLILSYDDERDRIF